MGRTRLHNAVIDGDLARTREQLSAGSDPNAADDNGWTPLHFAAQSRPEICLPLVQALLDAGADPNLRDSYGNTPLWRAVFNSRGNGSVIAALRCAGADPHAANRSGISPLRLARTIANFPVAQFFADLPVESDS